MALLARARNPLGKPLFDPKYALRLAKERNRCVEGKVFVCVFRGGGGCVGGGWVGG